MCELDSFTCHLGEHWTEPLSVVHKEQLLHPELGKPVLMMRTLTNIVPFRIARSDTTGQPFYLVEQPDGTCTYLARCELGLPYLHRSTKEHSWFYRDAQAMVQGPKKSRIPMSIFLQLLMNIHAGRPPAPYRIVFVARGHPVTRCRRRLRDATRHTVLPGAGRDIKLSDVLDILADCCGSARRCQRAEYETRMQNTFCCGPQDFSPFLEALVTKQYIQLSGDEICITPDP